MVAGAGAVRPEVSGRPGGVGRGGRGRTSKANMRTTSSVSAGSAPRRATAARRCSKCRPGGPRETKSASGGGNGVRPRERSCVRPIYIWKARGAAASLEPRRRSGGDCCAARGRTARICPVPDEPRVRRPATGDVVRGARRRAGRGVRSGPPSGLVGGAARGPAVPPGSRSIARRRRPTRLVRGLRQPEHPPSVYRGAPAPRRLARRPTRRPSRSYPARPPLNDPIQIVPVREQLRRGCPLPSLFGLIAPGPGCSARPRSAHRTPPPDRARTAIPPTASE